MDFVHKCQKHIKHYFFNFLFQMQRTISMEVFYTTYLNMAIKHGLFENVNEVDFFKIPIEDIKNNNVKKTTKEIVTKLFDKILASGMFKECTEAKTALDIYFAFINHDFEAKNIPEENVGELADNNA